MKEESTTNLLNILEHVDTANMDQYIKQHGKAAGNSLFFFDYLTQNDISSAQIATNLQGYLSKSYVYDIINGNKINPSRDVVLLMCIASEMERKLTRRALENYGHRDLYPKDTRDIIIATYINNKNYNIADINMELDHYQLPLLHEK